MDENNAHKKTWYHISKGKKKERMCQVYFFLHVVKKPENKYEYLQKYLEGQLG